MLAALHSLARRCRPRWLLAISAGLLLLWGCGDGDTSDHNPPPPTSGPDPSVRDCSALVFHRPSHPDPSRLAVVGPFNAWSNEANPLVDTNGDGLYQTRLHLPHGAHTYLIFEDGKLLRDAYNPLTLFRDGQEESLVHIPDCDRPALSLVQQETTLEGSARVQLRFHSARSGAPMDSTSVRISQGPQGNVKPTEDGVEIELQGLQPGKHALLLTATDTQGAEAEPLLLPLWIEAAPFDWRDALIYQIVVDRFRAGQGEALSEAAGISHYHGGDLYGIIDKIEDGYFHRLGINTLWLSPLYQNPDGEFVGRDGHVAEPYHGYWPVSFREVEDRFGGAQALDALVEAAHTRGLRVIVDMVLNHLHTQHPYYQTPPGPEWFNNPDGDCICGFSCPWSTHIQTCWFDPFLADLNWENPQVVNTLLEDTRWWVERFDLDGLRLDAVPMMPRLAMRLLRHRLQPLEPGAHHLYLLGETFTSRGQQGLIRHYIGPHALSGQFDFPVMWALRSALSGRTPMSSLDTEVLASEAAWAGSGAVMAPILGNHDVARFVSDIAGDPVWRPREDPPPQPVQERPYRLLRLAWTFLLTQPGAPVIYYGDEIGLAGGADPDNRRDMRFDDEVWPEGHKVLEHVQRLGQARGCSKALRRGRRRTLMAHESYLITLRDAGDGHPALVVLNRSNSARRLRLELPPELLVSPGARWQDLFGTPVQTEGQSLIIHVPPESSALLLTRCVPPGAPDSDAGREH